MVSKDEWIAAGRPAERFDLVDTNHDGKITVEELGAAIERMRQNGGAPAPSENASPPQPPPPPQPH